MACRNALNEPTDKAGEVPLKIVRDSLAIRHFTRATPARLQRQSKIIVMVDRGPFSVLREPVEDTETYTMTIEGPGQCTDLKQSRKTRKEEGKRLKRQRIEAAGGVRPRKQDDEATEQQHREVSSSSRQGGNNGKRGKERRRKTGDQQRHMFGRVMGTVPCRNKPRHSTLSIALPGSVMSNCQTKELKTHLAGQIARAATIYHVDEIVVYDDHLSRRDSHGNGYQPNGYRQRRSGPGDDKDTQQYRRQSPSEPHEFLARLLQFCECPQYLRRHFFPMHPDLQFAGLLPPIDAPHHVRAEDRSKYREGVVLDKIGSNGGSFVNCGIRNRPIE